VSEHEASAQRLCSSVRQFLIYSTLVLVRHVAVALLHVHTSLVQAAEEMPWCPVACPICQKVPGFLFKSVPWQWRQATCSQNSQLQSPAWACTLRYRAFHGPAERSTEIGAN